MNPAEPFRVDHPGLDPRVTVFRVHDEVDSFVVRTRRFTVLIDTTGTPAQCRHILDSLRAELAEAPLLVINTHADWDHAWGNAAIPDGTPIIAHEAAAARLCSAAESAVLAEKRAGSDRFAEVELSAPTMTFRGELTLHGGDLTLRLLHTPGHTPDHVAVWIPELRLCIAGDAAEDPLPEVTDPTAENLRLLRCSLRTLRDLAPVTVLPSHGETTSPDLLTANLAYFDTVAERVRALPADQVTFADCVPAGRQLTPEAREFYLSCHRKAVLACARSTQ